MRKKRNPERQQDRQDQRYEAGEGKGWLCRRCLRLTGLLACLLGFGFHTPALAGVVLGDFNGDGFKDLAVGVPNQNVGPNNEAGLVSADAARLRCLHQSALTSDRRNSHVCCI